MENTTAPTPDQLSSQAMHLYQDEEFDQAASLFEQAAQAYQQAGNALKYAEEKNNQSVALLRAGNPGGAYLASRGTEEVFARANDPIRQAKALGNQAAALEAQKKLSEAISLYSQAADILKSNNEPDLASLLLKSVSSIRMRQGKMLESLMMMRQALSLKSHLTLREKLIKSLSDFAFKLLNRPPLT